MSHFGSYQAPRKRQKRDLDELLYSEMSTKTSSRFLSAPIAHIKTRRNSTSRRRDDVDDFLSSDLELSFASNVSINSPPRDTIPLAPDESFPTPMDISPAPPPRLAPLTRPRAFTSAARMFGNDVSNTSSATPFLDESVSKAGSTHASSKKTQRAALPFEWLSTGKSNVIDTSNECANNTSDDAMDVDTSFQMNSPPVQPLDLAPKSAAPSTTTFNNLFYETTSPQRFFEDSPCAPQPKKRRSHSPDAVRHAEQEEDPLSSPGLASSPSHHKLQRISGGPIPNAFGKPGLQGLGCPPPSNGLKRGRRPVLSALVQPSEVKAMHSAYPILNNDGECESPARLPPARRAFSALLPPSAVEHLSEESSFEGPDDSSPAAQAYAQRQQAKTIRRRDGTEDFRPVTGATALTAKDSPRSFLGEAMPGFGDNEAHGKILPCHRVREDGLMRIKPSTVDSLLDGAYDSEIRDFHIVDCRFDYEYNGGHIPGAVNINTTSQVEELLLGPSLMKPRPSVSGDSTRKTVLVFHCEFSAKRAPTFAKHLRAKDRMLNNHVYPKILYPEVYILEGGYCEYFKHSGSRCEPSAYVRMDDPRYAQSSQQNMDQFRNKTKFGRHKSYAYGDAMGLGKSSHSQQQSKRNTAPSGGPTAVFAAASAARSRRGGPSLMTLTEDVQSTPEAGDDTDTETDLGDSPCPPPTRAVPVRGKNLARPLLRAETYGPARMPALGL